jgi:hypothetical protein
MKTKPKTCFALLVILCIGTFVQLEIWACEDSPAKPTISVSGAQAGSDQNYYVVEIPAQGPTTVTITASGQTPCPTDGEKCTCQYNSDKVTPDTDGDPKFTLTKTLGTQDPPDGPTVKVDVTQSTAPGEYKFQVTKIEQKYKACSQGWTGGVASKSNNQASDEITLLIYKVETETVATIPSDTKRTKLGVGEKVTLSFSPSSVTVNWAVAGAAGSVAPATGSLATYRASNEAANPEVTATFAGITKSLHFSVIEPSVVYINKTSAPSTNSPYMAINAAAEWYIGPTDVNFSQTKIAEGITWASTQGYFNFWSGLRHKPGSPLGVSNTLVSGKGWKCTGIDNVTTGTCGPSYSSGTFNWSIPWSYQIGTFSKQFATVDHHMEMGQPTAKWTLSLNKRQLSASVSEP